jgi:hypothetical protein
VNQRIFRDYLLRQGLSSPQHLKELLQNAQSVILLAHKVSAKTLSKGIVSFNAVFPQVFIESLFATLETRAQQMLRHELERQRVGSLFEILPHKGVLPVFQQLKDELDGFYRRMN